MRPRACRHQSWPTANSLSYLARASRACDHRDELSPGNVVVARQPVQHGQDGIGQLRPLRVRVGETGWITHCVHYRAGRRDEAEAQRAVQRALSVIDVRYLLRKVRARTLILQSRDDSCARRLLRRRIPQGRENLTTGPNRTGVRRESIALHTSAGVPQSPSTSRAAPLTWARKSRHDRSVDVGHRLLSLVSRSVRSISSSGALSIPAA